MHNLWTNGVTQTGGAISAFVPGHGVAMFTVTAVGKRPRQDAAVHRAVARGRCRRRSASAARPPCPSRSRISACPTSRSSACRCRPRAAGRSSRSAAAGARLLKPGQRFTVAYRVTAPASGPPLALSIFTGGASYDPLDGRRTSLARLGELVSSPVHAPLATADVTTHPAVVRRIRPGARDQRAGPGGVQPAVRGAADRLVRGDLQARRLRARARRRSRSPRTPPAEPRAAPG